MIRLLEGLIDVYLPDMKYFSDDLSMKYSQARDYFRVVYESIGEMFRQQPKGFAVELGVENGYVQEEGTVSESFISDFDNEGV